MNADGSDKANLTPDTGGEYPSWSPDGKQIVYIATVNEAHQIFVMNADGSQARQITHESMPLYFPEWSPDGQQIAFEMGRAAHTGYVYVMSADGSNLRKVSNKEGLHVPPVPHWSPDGEWLLFISEEYKDLFSPSTDYLITAARVDGSFLWTYNPGYIGILGPVWSPDGTYIAFTKLDKEGEGINLLDFATGDAANLTTNVDDENPVWSPDGNRIAFTSNRAGLVGKCIATCPSHVFVMSTDGTNLAVLPGRGQYSYSPTWSPDGEWIVFDCDDDLCLTASDGSGPLYIIDDSGHANHPSWQPVP